MKKLILELGPLLVFLLLNSYASAWLGTEPSQNLFVATAGFMAALLLTLGFSVVKGHRPSMMMLVSAGFVMVFGGLALWLQDETFIKIKPTIVYLLFAAILLAGWVWGTSYLKLLIGDALPLTDQGWMVLTKRWAIFFVVLAAINEMAWRNLSTDQWVTFKVFGFLSLTLIFSAFQIGLINRYSVEPHQRDLEKTAPDKDR